MRSLLLLTLLTPLGCDGDKDINKDSGETDTEPAPDEEECSEDVECSSWQICVEHECVDGDRNNEVDEAEAISLESDDATDGYINTTGDVDYFSFESGGGEFIFAYTDAHDEVAEGDPTPDTFLTLIAPDGTTVTTTDDFPNGWAVNNMDSAMWAYLSQSGTYTLKVEDANPEKGLDAWGGSDFSYSLSVRTWGQATYGSSTFEAPFSFGDDGLEMAENTLYAVGVVIEEAGQVDHILVDFPYSDAALYVDGTEDLQGSDMNPMASIVTMDGTLLSQRDEAGPNDGVYYPNLSAGGVMVTVEDADGGGGANHWAVLILKAYDEGDAIVEETEPNDAQAQATEIIMTEHENSGGNTYFDGTIWGDMSAPADVDSFKIEVSGDATTEDDDGAAVQYLVICSSSARWGSSIAPSITVTAEDGTELGSGEGDAGDYPNTRVENVAITPGEPVYLSVGGGADTAGTPDEWYLLRAYVASFLVSPYEDGGYSCPAL